ncbi:hypothetical protein AXG93_4891s1000 [Marchantia polymorpha subsp. ruderalis]|uniref:Uncharacterized protein n=1 Tax=Marchantia polymorpha subsp. ruderalis TaxID=1480154 RepID=A0A176W936_MARPO|nr:hypothetical protein AXG93_4891s1000 [Marchantia polymorpha subsp. ruderalis]
MAEQELRSKIAEIASKCDKEFQRAEELSAERRRLQEQLGKAAMRSEESQRRMEKAEEAYRHLQDEMTDELRLRVEKCLHIEHSAVLFDEVTASGVVSVQPKCSE